MDDVMDLVSPRGAAPPRRRHAAPTGPGQPGPAGPVAVAPYDGRHGPDGPRTALVEPGTTALRTPPQPASPAPAGLGGPDRRTPVRPGRRTTGTPAGPTTSTARRIGAGILAGAFLMLLVASVDSIVGAQIPMLGSFAAPEDGSGGPDAPPPMPPPPDTPGVCLNWNRPDAADTAAVDCARPHMFEQAGNVVLQDQPVFPTDPAWQKLVAQRCTPVVTGYLKGKFDPDGKFRVGALKPSPMRWQAGDRGMRCGLQSASRSGAMTPITGKVAAQDQSAVVPVGTCLGIDGRTIGDPVSCGVPHAVETVGVIDLGPQFKDAMPSVEDQDGFLQPACQKAAETYAGNGGVIAQKKLTVYWDNLSEPSWKAGSRKVNCNLATLLPDGSGFAAITGSVKGQLSVSTQPAPPTGSTPATPGPAGPGTPSSAPPSGSAPGPGAGPSGGAGAPAGPGAPAPPNVPDVPRGLPGLAP